MQFTATVLALISIAAQEKMALKARNLRYLRKHFMRFRLFDVFALLRHSFMSTELLFFWPSDSFARSVSWKVICFV